MSKMTIVNANQIIKCINIARQYPKYYLPLLEQQIHSFQNDFQYRINKQTICETNQGKDAWLIAKKFLQTQKPIGPLIELQGLSRAAENHAQDLEKMDQITHSGSDGSTFVDRIIKFCQKSQGALVEIIGNDFDINQRNHAQMIVLGLIIDDGVTSRGHRGSIFNPQYKYIGCGVAYLSGKVVGVINMSQSKLRQKPTKGNVSTSTTNLKESKMSKKSKQLQEVEQQNLLQSRASQRSKQSDASSSMLSDKSHKSQKVWTFTKVEEQSRKIVYQSKQKDQKVQPRYNNDSKISINKYQNESQPKSQMKENIPSKKSIQDSQLNRNKDKKSSKLQDPYMHTNMRQSKTSSKNQCQYTEFLGQQITNNHSLNQSKSLYNDSAMKSQGSSGFRKIKQKKESSRVWQEGQFKYEQKLTAIKYTDGTQQQFKQKTSLLLNEDPNQ